MCVLLYCYAKCGGKTLATLKIWAYRMSRKVYKTFPYTLHNNPEERRSHLQYIATEA